VLSPRSIALVGATTNPNAMASLTRGNFGRFDGPVHLVNPRYEAIGAERCFPSVASLPEAPDCVIAAVARDAVENVVLDAARAGAGGVVIFAAGYADTGEAEGQARQQRLTAIARETGLRIIGPNCVGLINHLRGFAMSFAPDVAFSPEGAARIGLISQSGGVSNGLAQALQHGTVFSHVLSAGNCCDVDVCDYVSFLADEPGCSAIALTFEGVEDPRRLLEAGEIAWAAGKPLVVFKLARGSQGARAAMSHTGFLAGSPAAYRALFDRIGAVQVESFHALIQTTSFFAKAGAPTANGVAIVGSSGGNLVLAVDEAEARGVPLPQPLESTAEALRAILPDYGSPRNPCDITGGASITSADLLSDATAILLDDPQFGAALYPLGYITQGRVEALHRLGALAAERAKLIVAVCTSEWLEGPGIAEVERNRNVCLFRSMDFCMSALAAWHAREQRLRLRAGDSRQRQSPLEAVSIVARLLEASPAGTLTERESMAVLGAYGVATAGARLAVDVRSAVEAAQALGWPVVLKIESPDIGHKTEVGGVRLNLSSPAQVEAAFAEVTASARKARPDARINGVLLEQMLAGGVEMLVGARVDPQFGPIVVAGLGGVMVELLGDSVAALAPVSLAEAKGMLDRLKGKALLAGYRGLPPVDRDALAAVVARVSELAADHAATIREIDVNPLICRGDRITAADALIVKGEAA